MREIDIYMHRCIQLASNGIGTASPNPLVGSVIVHNSKIIGEGWHYKAGESHAEVNAINSVKDPTLLKDATIYVSLEPCSHYGKTPPCSDLIIEKGIKKVVIGTIDPFAKVSGRGIKKLMDAGCDVTVGVLEKECNELNKRFFTYHTKKRPYIILKWAETTDGFIAPQSKSEREPIWISNTYSKQLVHKWRNEEDAIMVGSKTVIEDNPKLTTRSWHGKNPVRITVDRNGLTPKNSAITNSDAKSIIITSKVTPSKDINESTEYIIIDPDENNLVQNICDTLYNKNIQSVIIEGGTTLLQAFIDARQWDEARVFTGATDFKSGTKAPLIQGTVTKIKKIENDTLTFYKND